jgi:hypothetical protein
MTTLREARNMPRLDVTGSGDTATISAVGPRGGTRWVAELTEGQLRRFALTCEGQADLILAHKLDSDRWLRCICITNHRDPDRCMGQGTRANSGYCTGCRSVYFGTQGNPALITHIPAKR